MRTKKRKKKHWLLMIIAFVLGTLIILVALLRIGTGEAEWAGMTVGNLTDNLAVEYNIPGDEYGVVILWVEEQAYYSGIKERDLLKAINNQKIKNVSDFLRIAREINMNDGVLLDILRNRAPLYVTLKNKLGPHGTFKKLLNMPPEIFEVAYTPQTVDRNPEVQSTERIAGNLNSTIVSAAFSKSMANTEGRLPTPKEQKASEKILIEGHWMGMELIPLLPALAQKYGIPPNTKGLLVDEITLEAAESGLLAGDVVLAVDGVATPDLIAFTKATRRVRNRDKTNILVSRRGTLLKLTISSQRTLGFSQNEAAQPIMPGALRPHRKMKRSCTSCHIIMRTGGQLPVDMGDILPNPPPIMKRAVPPHENRGKCNVCHVILK